MSTPGDTGKHKAPEVPINGTADKTTDKPAQSPAEIEAEIEQQREQLAETLDALTAKLDVKSQAQAKVHDVRATTRLKVAETKDRATTDDGAPRPELLAAAAVLVVGVGAWLWWRHSR